jgi:serine O-acetyltransferase
MTLDDIQRALLASYDKHGGINHFDGINLPSDESVNRLATDFMHLLFPGFFEQKPLAKADVANITGQRLQAVRVRLQEELEKSLRFARTDHPAERAHELTRTILLRLPEVR